MNKFAKAVPIFSLKPDQRLDDDYILAELKASHPKVIIGKTSRLRTTTDPEGRLDRQSGTCNDFETVLDSSHIDNLVIKLKPPPKV